MNLLEETLKLQNQIEELYSNYIKLVELVMAELDGNSNFQKVQLTDQESTMTLSLNTGIFRGKKPISITFSNGETQNTASWKKVVEALLKDCIKTNSNLILLYEMCNKVTGRNRTILASSDEDMRSPIKISENLYFESHYDTENLLKTVITKIFNPIGYDYSNIKITFTEKQ